MSVRRDTTEWIRAAALSLVAPIGGEPSLTMHAPVTVQHDVRYQTRRPSAAQ